MLLTPERTEGLIWQMVRQPSPVRVTAEEAAGRVGCELDEARHALDTLVARNVLRRHEIPGERSVYWS